MRRSDREIKDFDEIIEVMKKCDVCRVAFKGDEFPYMVPLNFGMDVSDDKVRLYFHGATTGKKYDEMNKNANVCFEMDCGHNLYLNDTKMSCTMEYESVIGFGEIKLLPDEEKLHGLEAIMKHYHAEDFPFNHAPIPNTNVFAIDVISMTGKRRSVKTQG